MQHGMLSSSECFIINGQNALAFKLAKMGYDVWLGNNRGNIYSRKHLWLNPDGSAEDKKQFFDYSFVEMGQHDIPAKIDYILRQTEQTKLTYIGHSQGTTQMFCALAEDDNERISSKIELFIALAPITLIGKVSDKDIFY